MTAPARARRAWRWIPWFQGIQGIPWNQGIYLALLVTLVLTALPRPASASRPVIKPGREAEIEALFVPHTLGSELAPGWTLHSFTIEVGTIRVFIAGPDDAVATLRLDHPDHGPEDARQTAGFALATERGPPGSEAALAQLTATIERNDTGSFWQLERVFADDPPDARREATSPLHYGLERARLWVKDGLILLCALTLIVVGLSAHELRGAPRWMTGALVAIVVLVAALRIALSPQVALAPWPYTRFLVSARLIYAGPLLTSLHPDPIWQGEVITHSTLAFACLAPLAVFIHARYLLDDLRAALIAAALVALLPLHLRFSHSDVAFIPSITVSSLVFTLIHIATRERDRALAWAALALIAAPLGLMFLVRPLNIMYYPLLLATAFVHQGLHTDKPALARTRTGLAFVVISAVTLGGGVPWLLAGFGEQVSEGLSLETLRGALQVVFSPRMNALLNPRFTPPGLTLLALLGAVDLWRRGRKPLLWFLLGWLLAFLVAHAYIVPGSPYMQARYHLHLIVPYMLLAACGIEAALRWLAAREARPQLQRAGPWALALYLGASPLLHLGFIREVALNDVREWMFVHELREEIPDHCSILEYTAHNAGARFDRVGAYIHDGAPRSRWSGRAIEGAGDTALPEDIRALLEDPPACLYWYQGLPCYGLKRPGESLAQACDAIEGYVALEEQARVEFDSVPYDGNLAGGLRADERISLVLYRVYRRAQ